MAPRSRFIGSWILPRAVLAALALLIAAPGVSAQQAAGITGTVRDAEGLPIPGVTVEASSPALIERSITVFTDGEGRYALVDLRPGVYTVAFSLVGFSTLRREGIELNGGFTASVDIALTVGALEETITVTGAAAVVDTQTMRQQETLTLNDLESLPAGNIGLQTLAFVTPGFQTTQADVGGTRDTWAAQSAYTFYHGKTGTRAQFDGFRNQSFGAGTDAGYVLDEGVIQELQIELSGMGADAGSGTTSLNAIPKAGGNVFRGTIDGFFSSGAMQSSNIDDNLRSFGINNSPEVGRIYRLGAQLGGPMIGDRVWFFAAVGYWGKRSYPGGAFYNALQGQSGNPTPTLFYPGQPGTSFANLAVSGRRAADFDWFRNHSLRTTVQLTQRQRVSLFGDYQKSCRCTTGFTGANAIEASAGWDWHPSGVVQGTWTMAKTSRLLLEAGASWQVANWVNFTQNGVTRDDRSILEQATNYRYGAPTQLQNPNARTGRTADRFALTYVTGTHNAKVGVTHETAFSDTYTRRNNPDGINYDLLNGQPNRLQYGLDFAQSERVHAEVGVFAQDAWSVTDRLTVTGGLRLDYANLGWDADSLPATQFVPARSVPRTTGTPEWTDINPRYGFAYDVFGNGRTAVRFSAGRYNALTGRSHAGRMHPFTRSINNAFRNWNDSFYPVGDPRRNNYVPDCELANFAANGECGPMSNQFFGQVNPDATTFADDVQKDNREYLWDYNLEVAHEVITGLSINVGWNYNYDGAFQVSDNLAVGPNDFDEFCINVPADPRIPNGGGYEQCGLYDVKPALFGQGQVLVSDSDKYGKYQRYWNGFTVSANGRLFRGIALGGGIDIGKNVTDSCFTVDIPNQVRGGTGVNTGGPYCRQEVSMKDNLDVRIRGSVPLPYAVNVGFIIRNTRGAPINTTITASGSNVRWVNPNAGRTTLTAAQTVNVHELNKYHVSRFTQVDLQFAKIFMVSRLGRIRTTLDLYNALNGNTIQTVNGALGARYLYPNLVLDPRLMRVSATFDF